MKRAYGFKIFYPNLSVAARDEVREYITGIGIIVRESREGLTARVEIEAPGLFGLGYRRCHLEHEVRRELLSLGVEPPFVYFDVPSCTCSECLDLVGRYRG